MFLILNIKFNDSYVWDQFRDSYFSTEISRNFTKKKNLSLLYKNGPPKVKLGSTLEIYLKITHMQQHKKEKEKREREKKVNRKKKNRYWL